MVYNSYPPSTWVVIRKRWRRTFTGASPRAERVRSYRKVSVTGLSWPAAFCEGEKTDCEQRDHQHTPTTADSGDSGYTVRAAARGPAGRPPRPNRGCRRAHAYLRAAERRRSAYRRRADGPRIRQGPRVGDAGPQRSRVRRRLSRGNAGRRHGDHDQPDLHSTGNRPPIEGRSPR